MGAEMAYAEFLERKAQHVGGNGMEPVWMPDFLYPFQQALVDWAMRQARGGVFADCGLGKTPMQLAWAENVRRITGKPVLILTPLGVTHQTLAEAGKFGIDAAISRDGRLAAGITITNYERLHHFDRHAVGGTVCDESSALKAFDGERRKLVTEFLREQRWRLLCTATAAPNDYVELGTSSEALGYLGHMDMLGRFFVNDQNTARPIMGRWTAHGAQRAAWRFKGHAEEPFWRWVASWARAMRRPSDLGFSDDGFELPPLEYRQHVVAARRPPDGMLFDLPAVGLREERDELRRTLAERCEQAAELIQPHDISIAWCQLNNEGEVLERLIPRSIQVKGSDSEDWKEAAVAWFTGRLCICNHDLFRHKLAAWRRDPMATGRSTTQPIETNGSPNPSPINESAGTSDASTQEAASGDCFATPATLDLASSQMILAALSEPPCTCGHRDGRRRLISKPVMFGWGLNLQMCNHMTFFPSHSYEQFYQAVRRMWRFGQTHPVLVDIVTTEGGAAALKNLERKAAQADAMFDALVLHMRDALGIRRSDPFNTPVEVPAWLNGRSNTAREFIGQV